MPSPDSSVPEPVTLPEHMPSVVGPASGEWEKVAKDLSALVEGLCVQLGVPVPADLPAELDRRFSEGEERLRREQWDSITPDDSPPIPLDDAPPPRGSLDRLREALEELWADLGEIGRHNTGRDLTLKVEAALASLEESDRG